MSLLPDTHTHTRIHRLDRLGVSGWGVVSISCVCVCVCLCMSSLFMECSALFIRNINTISCVWVCVHMCVVTGQIARYHSIKSGRARHNEAKSGKATEARQRYIKIQPKLTLSSLFFFPSQTNKEQRV